MSFRTLVGGRLNEYRLPQQTNTAPVIFRGVVLDVIYDPKLLTEEEKDNLRNIVSNQEFLDMMPPNSVIAQITSNQQNNTDSGASVVYPFFQSHLMLPIQAGEQIDIIYEDYSQQGGSLGKWITRSSEGLSVEDPNYTHGDRRYDTNNNPGQQDVAQQRNRRNDSSSVPTPSFPNGSGNSESFTLRPSSEEPNVNPYDTISQNSNASRMHSFEPVPRWIKRPQELIIQSMNNSLIMLGQDRTGPATRPENSTDSPDKLKYSGTIDLVAGRGRFPIEPGVNTPPAGKETSPLTVRNTRNNLETDKTPYLRNRQTNIREGDPNYISDAARIYVSMNTDGDKNFKLLNGSDGISYPSKTLSPSAQPTGPNEDVGPSYIVTKADHVRIVARKSADPEIKGTFLLVKEGSESDLAFMYIDESGKMQLQAPKVYIGAATDENEPYIKWSKFKETVDHLNSEINTLKIALDALKQLLTTSAAASSCTPFSPDTAWVQLATSINSVNTEIASDKSSADDAVQASKSEKIFGE